MRKYLGLFVLCFAQLAHSMELADQELYSNAMGEFQINSNSSLSLVDNFFEMSISKKRLAKEIESNPNDPQRCLEYLTLKFHELISWSVGSIDSGKKLIKALMYHEMLFSEFSQDFIAQVTQEFYRDRVGYLMLENNDSDMELEKKEIKFDAYFEEDNTIGILNVHTATLIKKLKFPSSPRCFSFSDNYNAYLALGYSNGSTYIVNWQKEIPEYLLIQENDSVAPVMQVALLEDGKILVVCRNDGAVSVWRIRYHKNGGIRDAAKIQHIDMSGSECMSIDFNDVLFQTYEDKYLALCIQKNVLKIYNLVSGEQCWQRLLSGQQEITNLCWKPSGDLIASTDQKVFSCFGLPNIQSKSVHELLMHELLLNFACNGYSVAELSLITPTITISNLPINYVHVWQNLLDESGLCLGEKNDRALVIHRPAVNDLMKMNGEQMAMSGGLAPKPTFKVNLINFLILLGLELLQQIP